MANKQINELTELTTLADGDLIPVYDIDEAGSEKTKKVSMNNLGVSGTWTPVIADAESGGNTGTATLGNCTYTKIGNEVTLRAAIQNIDTTGMTGGNYFYIQGLPFTPAADNYSLGSAMLYNVSFTGYVVSRINQSAGGVSFNESQNGGVWDLLTVSNFTAGTVHAYFQITYKSV